MYSENSEQKTIYTEAQKLFDGVLNFGKQCVIIAYGQTGTGKTFTIQGTEKEPGLILQAI